MNHGPTFAQRRYWDRVSAMGCVICHGVAEIAHCHGGSLVEKTGVKAKGVKLRYMHWLVLPLCVVHHRDTSEEGLDRDVGAWEARFGSQVGWIDVLITRTGVNVWELAKSRHAWAG